MLWTFYGNHPSRLPSISNINYEIKFADMTRNCEDGILDEANDILILSCDPGRDQWNTVMVPLQKRSVDLSADMPRDCSLTRTTLAASSTGTSTLTPNPSQHQ